jgi:hypothetical protein
MQHEEVPRAVHNAKIQVIGPSFQELQHSSLYQDHPVGQQLPFEIRTHLGRARTGQLHQDRTNEIAGVLMPIPPSGIEDV